MTSNFWPLLLWGRNFGGLSLCPQRSKWPHILTVTSWYLPTTMILGVAWYCNSLFFRPLLGFIKSCTPNNWGLDGALLAGANKIKIWNIKRRLIPYLWVGTRRSLSKFEVAVTSGDRARGRQSFDLIVVEVKKWRSSNWPQIKILLWNLHMLIPKW